jgi:hypothetical protein
MFNLFLLSFGTLVRLFRNRRDLVFENFVLRQQLTVLKRRLPRPNLNLFDKLFWVVSGAIVVEIRFGIELTGRVPEEVRE